MRLRSPTHALECVHYASPICQGVPQTKVNLWLRMASVYRRATDECAFPPLDIRIQAIPASTLSLRRCRTAWHTRLLPLPALQTCSCSLALSGLGKSFASASFTLNADHLWWLFFQCVPRDYLKPGATFGGHLAIRVTFIRKPLPFLESPQLSPCSPALLLGYFAPVFDWSPLKKSTKPAGDGEHRGKLIAVLTEVIDLTTILCL